MKKNVLLTAAMSCAMLVPALQAKAQGETVVVEEETVAVSEVPCKTHYYVPKTDNWFKLCSGLCKKVNCPSAFFLQTGS